MATRFFCENPDCKRHQELTIVGNVTFRYRDGSFQPDNQYCEECKSLMAVHEIPNEGDITCNYAGFGSMNSDQKKAVLKKRTAEMDKKNDAQGVKEHYKNQALNKFFGK